MGRERQKAADAQLMPWEWGNRKSEWRAQMWRTGEGTGTPKPGQGEMCFPNSSPAAGTTAERALGKKQVVEAE